jgi:hypothetical protein
MNRIIMIWAIASLLTAVTAATGKTAEISAAASQAAALDAAAAVSESVLWSFFRASGDGQFPFATLIADKRGNLYGTTLDGGTNCPNGVGPPASDCGGTVFELSPPAGQHTQWRETVLWSFGASGDGAAPAAGVIADKRGNLYGTGR